VSDEEWPPPEARARAALWEAERRLKAREYVAAAVALEDAVARGDTTTAAVARGLRQLAASGYRHESGDAVRARRHLAGARERLAPFVPTFEEVALDTLLALVALSLRS
jgi:hypothetical protein